MSREDFNAYLAALEKSSDRARSVIYVFIIVYIAILIYALNSFAYPTRQLNFDKIREIIKCRYALAPGQIVSPSARKECYSDDLLGPKFFDELKNPPQLQEDMEKNLWQYELQKFYDDSLSLRTFQVPFFGFTTDRDVVWIAFPFIGILGYYIIWLALGRVHSLFRDLAEQNKSDATRLRLILSTQFLTSPLSEASPEFSRFHKTIWKLIGMTVLLVPLLVSLVGIADQTNLNGVIRQRFLGWEPWRKPPFFPLESVHFGFTLGFASEFFIQLGLIVLQFVLLFELIGVFNSLGQTQATAQRSAST